jgi:hypothetical protein
MLHPFWKKFGVVWSNLWQACFFFENGSSTLLNGVNEFLSIVYHPVLVNFGTKDLHALLLNFCEFCDSKEGCTSF